MSVQAKAPGNAPATGMPKTPAPDAISSPRSGGGQGYGTGGPVGNSPSVPPGKRVLSPLAQNLESSVDDDGVLAAVIARGAKMADSNFETRSESDASYPPAHGMRNRSDESKGTIPGSIGGSNGPLPKGP